MGLQPAPTNDAEKPSIAEWFLFDGLALELGLGLGRPLTVGCSGVNGAPPFKVRQTCELFRAPARLRPDQRRGSYCTWDDFTYTIQSGTNILERGARTDGVVETKGPLGSCVSGILDFWQNYDKAIEVEPECMRLWFWPRDGQWPRGGIKQDYQHTYDRFLTSLQREGGYYLQGGIRKGHTVFLDWSGENPTAARAALEAPLLALPAASYIAGTFAAPGMFAPPGLKSGDEEADAKLMAFERMVKLLVDSENPAGLLFTRSLTNTRMHQYGWMDFGDITTSGFGPENLAGDWPWIVLVQLLRTGDRRLFKLAQEMIRHRTEIDQMWADRDEGPWRGWQRLPHGYTRYHSARLWRGWSPSGIWLQGVVLYHLLTGDALSRECAETGANAIALAWQRARTDDMAAVGWSIISLLAMHDLTGDRKWINQALELFNRYVVPVWKERGPHLHDPRNQFRSQEYQKEDYKYCYSIEALCELERRTGDPTVRRLLEEGALKETLPANQNAPLFMAGLCAYVSPLTGKKETLERAVELFNSGFPESKCPPIHLPGNSAWPFEAVTMFRAVNVFQYGLSRSQR